MKEIYGSPTLKTDIFDALKYLEKVPYMIIPANIKYVFGWLELQDELDFLNNKCLSLTEEQLKRKKFLEENKNILETFDGEAWKQEALRKLGK